MLILFTDVETSGLSCEEHRILEIAAILYCTNTSRVLNSYQALLDPPESPIPEEITKINGITTSLLKRHGLPAKYVFHILENDFVSKADFYCGHNSQFDRGFIDKEVDRLGLKKWEKPWLCTSVDVKYPEHIATRKLTHLAAEHGFVNPFPHTSLADTLTCLRVFTEYSFPEILKRNKTANITVRALVDFANKERAKRRGYRWEDVSKKWLKQIKEDELSKEKKECDFEIEVQK